MACPKTSPHSILQNNNTSYFESRKWRIPQATPSFFTKQRPPPPYLQIINKKNNSQKEAPNTEKATAKRQ